MKSIGPRLRTLFLAHAAGSFCAYIPVLFERHLHQVGWDWVFIALAPLSMLLYLPALTVLHLLQFYSFQPGQWDFRFMPLTWICYTVPFVLVCLIRRRQAPTWKWAIVPIVVTLLFAGLWLHACARGLDPIAQPARG